MIKRARQSIGYSYKSLLTFSHTSRTIEPTKYKEDLMKDLVMKNLGDFRNLVKFNAFNGIYLYKINGDIVPIATHPFNTFNWKKEYKYIFDSIGKWMEHERFRLIVEPIENLDFGQEQEKDVLNDLACLRYYIELLRTLKVSPYNKVLVSVGSHSNKQPGDDHFIKNYFRMPTYIKKYVALYNEDTDASMEETLYVANVIQIPVVYNYYGELKDFRSTFMLHKRAIIRTWKVEDGNPIIQIFEKKCDTKKEFFKLIKYDDCVYIAEVLNQENISLVYESSFKDIAASKIANVITEARGVFLKEACVKEWQRYRHLVMAHDPDSFVEMQNFMEKPTSFKEFYLRIEKSLSHFKLMPNDIFAAEELLDDFGDTIKTSEYKKAIELLKQREMEAFKHYCHKLAEKYEIEAISSSYYFHLD